MPGEIHRAGLGHPEYGVARFQDASAVCQARFPLHQEMGTGPVAFPRALPIPALATPAAGGCDGLRARCSRRSSAAGRRAPTQRSSGPGCPQGRPGRQLSRTPAGPGSSRGPGGCSPSSRGDLGTVLVRQPDCHTRPAQRTDERTNAVGLLITATHDHVDDPLIRVISWGVRCTVGRVHPAHEGKREQGGVLACARFPFARGQDVLPRPTVNGPRTPRIASTGRA